MLNGGVTGMIDWTDMVVIFAMFGAVCAWTWASSKSKKFRSNKGNYVRSKPKYSKHTHNYGVDDDD